MADTKLEKRDYTALISIGIKGEEHCSLKTGNNLYLDMWDVTPLCLRRRRELPPVSEIVKLIEWAQGLANDDYVLCHCKQGASRSTACAVIAYQAFGYTDETAVSLMYSDAARAQPNWYILSVADQLLGRNALGLIRASGRRLKTTRRDVTL